MPEGKDSTAELSHRLEFSDGNLQKANSICFKGEKEFTWAVTN
jgi:hypothetical protein